MTSGVSFDSFVPGMEDVFVPISWPGGGGSLPLVGLAASHTLMTQLVARGELPTAEEPLILIDAPDPAHWFYVERFAAIQQAAVKAAMALPEGKERTDALTRVPVCIKRPYRYIGLAAHRAAGLPPHWYSFVDEMPFDGLRELFLYVTKTLEMQALGECCAMKVASESSAHDPEERCMMGYGFLPPGASESYESLEPMRDANTWVWEGPEEEYPFIDTTTADWLGVTPVAAVIMDYLTPEEEENKDSMEWPPKHNPLKKANWTLEQCLYFRDTAKRLPCIQTADGRWKNPMFADQPDGGPDQEGPFSLTVIDEFAGSIVRYL